MVSGIYSGIMHPSLCTNTWNGETGIRLVEGRALRRIEDCEQRKRYYLVCVHGIWFYCFSMCGRTLHGRLRKKWRVLRFVGRSVHDGWETV